MPDAVVEFAVVAHDHRKVGEVGAVMALVSVLCHRVTVFELLDGGVACRHFARGLHRQSRLHLILHEGTLAQLEVGVLHEFGLDDCPGRCVDSDRAQIPYILRNKPFDWEDRDFFSRPPVYLLALGPILEPGPSREVDRLSDIEPCGEAGMVSPGKSEDKFPWFL
jgi:hypothetical protein